MFNVFIDRPILSTVVSLIITLARGIAALGLPITQYPQIVPPEVHVATSFPSATAEVGTESIAAPVDQQVSGPKINPHIDTKSATAKTNTPTVTMGAAARP